MGVIAAIKEWKMNAYVYGYSIRYLRPDEDWTKQRRSFFLLDESVEIPKSVDANVWEEVAGQEADSSFGKIRLPCWEDRDEMLKITAYNSAHKDKVELTIVVFVEDEEPLPEIVEMNSHDPIDQPTGFFIGYDIADDGLISALSNCGFSEHDRIVATDKYARYLNRHGLFEDVRIANQFAADSEIRVPEHSPFYVFGLYLDKEIEHDERP